MNLTRRALLRNIALASAASGLGWMKALAAPATDYKALVCLFMFGGNDGNNLLVPMNSDEYANYASIRAGLALPSSSLVSLGAPKSQPGRNFGLHPGLAPLQPIWQEGKLALLCNVGTLTQPLTMSQYLANQNRPYSLFSHSDQQLQWMTSESVSIGQTGWAGRMADVVQGFNTSGAVPTVISVAGSSRFGFGAQTSPLVVPSSGTFGLYGGTSGASGQARLNGLTGLAALDRQNVLAAASSDVMTNALASSAILNPILTNASSAAAPAFSGLTDSLSKQLFAVAKIIEARQSLGFSRQIFFVSLNGFDTHSNQLATQNTLLSQVGTSLAAFYNAMAALNTNNNVTTFTVSDFARTFRPASGGGTDHAWGNHHMIMGGAVNGGDLYGTFPTLQLKGPSDVDGSGRWLPTTSVDQYAATLASWFGVSASNLARVLPYLSNFSQTNLGFV
jgi:uncharacterized protein (DUF1501 family)